MCFKKLNYSHVDQLIIESVIFHFHEILTFKYSLILVTVNTFLLYRINNWFNIWNKYFKIEFLCTNCFNL